MSDTIAEIKRLYYSTSRESIERDFARAIDLVKSMASEEERQRVAVYMEGLAEMRSGWGPKTDGGSRRSSRKPEQPRRE